MVRSNGIDAYTGRKLRWDLISKYDNDESKTGCDENKDKYLSDRKSIQEV